MKNLNSFSAEVKNQLAPFFQEVVNTANSDAEADMMLMGAITPTSISS